MSTEEFQFIFNFYVVLILALGFTVFLCFIYYCDKRIPLTGITNLISVFFVVGVTIYIGFRDLRVGVDTDTYAYLFDMMSISNKLESSRDPLWDSVMYLFSKFTVVSIFFTFCGLIYVGAAFLAMRNFFGRYSYFSLLLFFIVPNFMMAGINGIRNGVAASIFLLAISLKNKFKIFAMLVLALFIHLSMILPFIAYYISGLFKTIRYPLLLWLCSIVAYFTGITLFSFIPQSLVEGRLALYIEASTLTSNDGAIINFLVYGISPIITGIYFIYFKKYKDHLYIRLLNTYILTNIVYIMVMTLPYADRFAYLSEFLLPIVLVYPLLKGKIWSCQFLIMSIILFLVFFIKAYKILFN